MDVALLWTLPGLPLFGAIVLAIAGRRASPAFAASMAGGTALGALGVAIWTLAATLRGMGARLAVDLGTWFAAGPTRASAVLAADPLTASMAVMVAGVGFLILLFSAGYMDAPEDRPGSWRFYACMDLFLGSMLLLVLADDLLLLFVGWEGVGVCSWLLIGYWFQDPVHAAAARKAFVVNRVGDAALLLALALLVGALGPRATLRIPEMQAVLAEDPSLLAGSATAAGLLLLFAATGKSAQIPLYTWLPDAMVGPTPVSALIHAATMVTAGAWLLLRLHFVLALSPVALGAVAVVGAASALWAGLLAIFPHDLKRVLAYSTISQLGLLFLGIGVGAGTAAYFHLLTHAFFKALLFLAAGSVVHALHHQDVRRMGGLARRMPWTTAAFLVGFLAIVGFPGFSGFFSKDAVLFAALAARPTDIGAGTFPLPVLLCMVGFVAALLTALYMSRILFLVFFGRYRGEGRPRESRPVLVVPLLVLSALALFGGLLDLPAWIGVDSGWLTRAAGPHLGGTPPAHGGAVEAALGLGLALASLAVVAWAGRRWVDRQDSTDSVGSALPGTARFLAAGGRVDGMYDALVVRPLRGLARSGVARLEASGVQRAGRAAAALLEAAGAWNGRVLQRGPVQDYALGIALGAAFLLLLAAVS
ncbi:MAG: NADH-quinone oxidoreductase subunit L [Deltaproteobacteria bacterium]|nr:NADH-quinone oxidoreductase subunit L [Deltaproteobacteria bacterium]